ncbi:UbiA family prenyltransferase [Streptomyces ehimensis]|uniref:UbiA family prenyltransferase n=1 Tax=Streptomyces ehimensis TaxID=68195 RepID=A0ABV9BEL5_9ACTN
MLDRQIADRIRVLVILSRPAVAVLFALYVALGLAQAGHAEDRLLLAGCLIPVMAFLLCSVCVNDLSDRAIDQVNLPGDRNRPLVTAAAGSRELVVTAVVSATVALGSAFVLGPRPGLLMLAALAVSAGYSLRPIRLADRGAVAALALPACYVALPYLLALTAARSAVHPRDLLMLLGLYIGFVGRILLKDFRDVRGDALFGKRTFLVRHGRRTTCLFSACAWTIGSFVILAATPRRTPALVCSYLLCLVLALVILRVLAGEVRHRREEALITGAAAIGRGMLILQLAHLATDQAGWGALARSTVMGALLALTLAQAIGMLRHGPTTGLTVASLQEETTASRGARRRPGISGREVVHVEGDRPEEVADGRQSRVLEDRRGHRGAVRGRQ